MHILTFIIKLPSFVLVNECKRVWKNIRERFAKEKKKSRDLEEAGFPSESNWPCYNSLSFLDRFVVKRL